jgi:hypothetical protein
MMRKLKLRQLERSLEEPGLPERLLARLRGGRDDAVQFQRHVGPEVIIALKIQAHGRPPENEAATKGKLLSRTPHTTVSQQGLEEIAVAPVYGLR